MNLDFNDATGSEKVLFLDANGDAGAGVFQFENGKWNLVGITSHQVDLNLNGMFGNYGDRSKHTRLDAYMPWIQSKIPAPDSSLVIGIGLLGTRVRRRYSA